jgi:hypothetical protein
MAVAFVLITATPASAGRLVATGHDADLHCSTEGLGCNFVRVAVDYVRAGSTRPVLVLDRGALQLVSALDLAFEPNLARTIMDPRSPQFASEPLTTNRYSAILVASDESCGGCDLNEPGSARDSRAINSRADDIAAFFNDGGGVYANSGGLRADGESGPADVYYDFLPLPEGGQAMTGPFCLTPIGARIGFEDQLCPNAGRHSGDGDDINCCPTHNSFDEPPDDSAIRIADVDVAQDGEISFDDVAETLVADGVVSGGDIVPASPPPPILGQRLVAGTTAGKVFIKFPARGSARVSQKGSGFVPLMATRAIPVRSILDTRQGTVALRLARNRKGRTQSGRFGSGLFQVLQSRKKRAKGLTTLQMKGSAARFRRCGGKGSASGDALGRSSLSRRAIRRLRARSKGRYRTRGRHSAATVRGTVWNMTDSCAGTLTTVKRGKVAVRDFRLKKTIVLRAGKSYLARP